MTKSISSSTIAGLRARAGATVPSITVSGGSQQVSRIGKVQITVWADPEFRKQLKRCALDRGVTVNDLVTASLAREIGLPYPENN